MEGESFLCGTIYRSPANDAMSNEKFKIKLQNCLNKIDVKEKCYIFGDFNYDLAQTTENTHVYEFTEIMLNHSFFSVINKPTRITDTTATVLDQLWANSFCYAVKSNILLHPISDHLPIFMCINLCMNNSSACTTVRCFNDNNMSKFYYELENIDELPILKESDVNESFTCFMKEYNRVFENCFPLTAVKNYAKNKSWFDKDLQILLQEKETLFKKYLKKKTLIAKVNYNKARNSYFRTLKIKKDSYYSSLLAQHESNLKQTWKAINNLLGKVKTGSCTALKIGNQVTSDAQSIANLFNLHFVEVGSKLVKKLRSTPNHFGDYLPPATPNSIYFYPTTPRVVKNIISELQSKTSRGMDGIPTKVLKSTPDNVIYILTHIFNLSLRSGIFLNKFKLAKVEPIFKKGARHDVNNYRPISLLPVFSKILEKLIYRRLLSFLTRQNFFHENQFGFRKNYSTSHAATLLVENITNAFEEKKKVIGVFLDLSKAFDTIDHNILLRKLQHYGVRGLPLDWFSSYLSNRFQQVLCNDHLSDKLLLNCSVPQGSILGPLFFLIYVYDFSRCISTGKTIMFADDTNLFFSDNCYNQLFRVVNKELTDVDHWLMANKLSLNISKTNYIVFRTLNSKLPRNLPSLKLRNNILKRVSNVRFLGTILYEHLSWKPHMEVLLQKIRLTTSVVNKIKSLLNKQILFTLYNSLIKSHIQYCILIWCNGNKTMVQRLQSAANKFVRLIFKLDLRESVKDLMQQLGILTINQLAELETANFMYKYLYNKLPIVFNGLLDKNTISEKTHGTRCQSKLFPLFRRIELTKQSMKYRGPRT